jgi:uncharacterized protein YaaR (DUF327 family)
MSIKIEQDWKRLSGEKRTGPSREKPTVAFKSFVQSQWHEKESERMEGLLAEIEEQGKRLSRSRTVRDLQLYKKLIQEFLQKAVSFGLALSQSHSWHSHEPSVQTIVKKIDERLMALTDQVLREGAEPIQILGMLDEIKGLLINLYR